MLSDENAFASSSKKYNLNDKQSNLKSSIGLRRSKRIASVKSKKCNVLHNTSSASECISGSNCDTVSVSDNDLEFLPQENVSPDPCDFPGFTENETFLVSDKDVSGNVTRKTKEEEFQHLLKKYRTRIK